MERRKGEEREGCRGSGSSGREKKLLRDRRTVISKSIERKNSSQDKENVGMKKQENKAEDERKGGGTDEQITASGACDLRSTEKGMRPKDRRKGG